MVYWLGPAILGTMWLAVEIARCCVRRGVTRPPGTRRCWRHKWVAIRRTAADSLDRHGYTVCLCRCAICGTLRTRTMATSRPLTGGPAQ